MFDATDSETKLKIFVVCFQWKPGILSKNEIIKIFDVAGTGLPGYLILLIQLLRPKLKILTAYY